MIEQIRITEPIEDYIKNLTPQSKHNKVITSGLMGPSDTIQWGTPYDLFDKLNNEFHFTLDVCASDGMQMCKRYFNPEINGLNQKWGKDEVCWMNPPYGKDITKWVRKASLEKAVTVALLPARTDTKWFQKWVQPYASEIRFIAGRLKFRGMGGGAILGRLFRQLSQYTTLKEPPDME